MSDEVNFGADQSFDVFDEVVETGDFDVSDESGGEESSSGDSESVDNSGDQVSDGEDSSVAEDIADVEESAEEVEADEESESEEAEEEESESQEDEEDQAEADSESEDGEDDQGSSAELVEAIESGTLEIELGENTVTLKDLKDDFIGRQEVARRFSDLDVQRKAHDRDVEEIETYINDFAGLMRKGDAMGAMSYFGTFSGMPPHQVKEALITQLGPEIIRRQQMTPQEIQAEYLQAENSFLQGQRESEAKIREEEQAQVALQDSIRNLRETHNIQEQEYREVEHELRETLEQGEELTPETVIEGVQFKRDFILTESVFSNYSGQLSEENGEMFFDSLLDVKQKYPHFTEEDLKEVAESALAQIKQSSVKEKLTKKVTEKKKIQSKKKQSSQIQESEEIDPELEDWL